MLADFGEAACSLLLAVMATYLVMPSGGTKLTYIMMVVICNLHVE
jgi:hypothetical protein